MKVFINNKTSSHMYKGLCIYSKVYIANQANGRQLFDLISTVSGMLMCSILLATLYICVQYKQHYVYVYTLVCVGVTELRSPLQAVKVPHMRSP